MANRKRRAFSTEFKAEAVRLTRVGDRTIGQVARDLDLTESVLRGWVQRTQTPPPPAAPEALSAAEREELVRLRRENKQLQMDRDILRKAAAFFAKENA